VHDDEPHEFVAVQVTAVVPLEKVLPLAGTHVILAAGVPVAVGPLHVTILLSH
jgi:hypothetical protein